MIDAREVSRRARELGVDPGHIETDHIMNCVLAAIADAEPGLMFRGGTALARAYWSDFRLSEDLDFLSDARAADVEGVLRRAAESASRLASVNLDLDFGPPKSGWSRSRVRSTAGELLIDVNFGERAYLPLEDHLLVLPYSDLRDQPRTIRCVALAEILGNKWFMLADDERKEPRDLYDVWAGTCRFDVPFQELARGHKAKYGFFPNEGQLRQAQRLKDLWETRLAHQLGELPPFDEMYSAVRDRYAEWRTASDSG
ncbi:MAG TPA: nucleotidyl transferase AbiEii/AbiGii toxin family protein [Actinomycetota bacterium]|nr:nucleotidyl transferase AbiEii/AbiGii toxin family protein [Actinomycetota bacterium]